MGMIMKKANNSLPVINNNDLVSYVKYIPDFFLTLTLGIVFINDLTRQIFSYTLFDSKSVILALLSPLIMSIVLMFIRLLNAIRQDIVSLKRLDLGVLEVLSADNDIPCEDLMKNSKSIKILTELS